mgnify:CR=1 FL=1
MGGGRRSWIRGITEVAKRYLMQVAAHNLGVILRKLLGVGTPRGLGSAAGALRNLFGAIRVLLTGLWISIRSAGRLFFRAVSVVAKVDPSELRATPSSTGC